MGATRGKSSAAPADTPGVSDSVRLLLVDDHRTLREGLRLSMEEAGFVVAGEAGDGEEAVRLAEALRPDVVLMDVRMPVLDGIEATRRITADSATTGVRVLILTTFDLDEYVFEALRAGASGFLTKDVEPEELREAVRTVAAGHALLAPSVTRRLIEEFSRQPVSDAPPPTVLGSLTARELEVLKLIARGLTNAEIAAELFVSDATVKTHVAHLLAKLQLRDRVQAVVLAYESGLVRPGTR